MKPSHAAALAVVGWYLMVPPFSENPSSLKNVPLSKWSIYKRYSALDECRYARSDITAGWLQDPLTDFVQRFGNNFKSFFARAQCIETDDRRLKEK